MSIANTKKREIVRLSLDLSSETNEILERLANDSHVSKADILRKAIALMEVATDAKKRGQKFGVANKDQNLATEIVGL
jgi:predicted transcriptional regulator